MLESLRRHSQSWLIYGFFAIIIVVFVFFFGPQSDGCSPSRSRRVAEVDGVGIGSLQLEQLAGLRRVVEVTRGQEIDPGQRRLMLAQDLALTRLLAEEAREAGMAVSDEQLSEYVRSPRNPDLYEYADRDLEFDYEKYETSVAPVFGMDLSNYEQWKEDELLATELLTLLRDSVLVSDLEVANHYRLRNTHYDLEYVRFDPEELGDLFEVSDAEVAELLTNDPERVRSYYDAHLEEYTSERELRFRRIYIALDPSDPEPARTRFDDCLAQVEAEPERFAEIASECTDNVSEREVGGDMGWKTADAYATFRFDVDVEPNTVQTYEGAGSLVIYRLEEERPATTQPFEEVQEEVARTVLEHQRGDAPVRELAEWFLAQAQTGMTLTEVSLAHAQLLEEEAQAAPAGEGEEAPPSADDEATADEAGGDEGDEGDEAGGDEGGEAGEAEVAEGENGEGEGDGDSASSFLEPVVEVRETGPFAIERRYPPDPLEIPNMGRLPRLARDLTGLTPENPVAPEVYEDGEAYYVARLTSLEEAPEEIPEEDSERLANELRFEKVRLLYSGVEARLIEHRIAPLNPFMQDILQHAEEDGELEIDYDYFVWEEPQASQ